LVGWRDGGRGAALTTPSGATRFQGFLLETEHRLFLINVTATRLHACGGESAPCGGRLVVYALRAFSLLFLNSSSGLQAHGHPVPGGGLRYGPEALEQQNQVQSFPSEPHGHQRRWSPPQHRSAGLLPQPEPEEEAGPFILDLQDLPDLATADINSQNPNIQVSYR